jgi:hypothetical protein
MAITPARERVRKSRERKRRRVIPVQVEVSTLEIIYAVTGTFFVWCDTELFRSWKAWAETSGEFADAWVCRRTAQMRPRLA